MDCKQMLAILAAIFVALPALAHGTEHIVGDYSGWTLGFDYATWAESKVFRVGDTLVFKYPVGVHNVFKVSAYDFQACNVPSENEAMATGNDVITLATPGKKWYICGKAYGAHCQKGQKLVINVHPAAEATPAPAYSSPPAWGPPANAPSYSAPPAPQAPAPSAGTSYPGPTQHIVGDDKGWTLNFNYTAWAEGRQFFVGDTLVFKYAVGAHNVFKVSGSEFEQCSVPPENQAMASGNDVIALATPGKKWYLCGKAEGKHCWAGMKLFIVVLPVPSTGHPPAAPPSNSSAPGIFEPPLPAAAPSSYDAPPATPAVEPPLPAAAPSSYAAPPATPSGPRKFYVGDDKGWTLNFDYNAWAKGKEFRVGDVLVFKYPVGVHNVFKVGSTAFKSCAVPAEEEAMTTGHDEITLATPGKKWYICGKAYGQHCQHGQRLAIKVQPAEASSSPSAPSTEKAPAWKAPAPSSAPAAPTQHIVGDEKGWTLNFNYTAWAEGREFRVGDALVFKYPVGVHNVFKVDGPSFQACNVPPEDEALASGNDVIALATPGRKWYICGKAYGKHCQMGQKLFINVLPSASPIPSSDAPSNSPSWKTPAPVASPPSSPASKKFVVGDNYGWTLNFNYTAWAEGKEFRVGDKLVFKYVVGKHNVFKVDGPAFQACVVPPPEEALASGSDVITLATPGRKWYICGKAYGKHCQMGMKLFVNVLPAAGQAPAESPPSGYTPSPPSGYTPTHHHGGNGRRLLK